MRDGAMQDRLYIDGEWIRPEKGGTLDVINPATEEVIHKAPAGTSGDIDKAVKAARYAFDSGPWPRLTGAERAVYLRAIADKIAEKREFLARLEVVDNGKPLPEALWDIDDVAGCFNYYAGLAEELDHDPEETIPLIEPRFSARVVREPLGVVGAITPWNYPLLMVAWKVAPALAAGCTMVLKPSELTPLTALELGVIAGEVGLPARRPASR
jgi:betaine-aldehyde dehydrogenase